MSNSKSKVVWLGSSREDISAFPRDAKQIAGHQLHQVECGTDPDHWRPMPSVGAGVNEIIVETGDAFRVFYIAKFDQKIYVLHAFQKTTQQTAKHDLDRGRKLYRELVELRRQRKAASKRKR